MPAILYVQAEALIRECVSMCLSQSYKEARIFSFASVQECCLSDVERSAVLLILYGIDRARAEHDLGDELAQLSRTFPTEPIILLSDAEDRADHVREAIRKGVRGFISTSATLDVVLGAVRVVRAGGSFIPMSSLAAQRPPGNGGGERMRKRETFTPRQIAVLKRLRQGSSNRTIAKELDMSESRVKAHMRNLMQKLDATNRTQVAILTKGFVETA